MKFDKLFEPGKIGSVELKNRIIRSGAGTESAQGSRLSDANYELYKAWARGGVGLIITEGIYVTYELDFYAPGSPRFDSDEYLLEMAKLAADIHEAGAKTFMQILHLGTWNLSPDSIPISSSTLTEEENPPMEQPFPPTVPPRGITKDEIPKIIAGFVDIAERAKRAGFDGVEINAAGAHFLNSFLSRLWNKRDDEYGAQSYENRTRIICEIIHAIKAECGQDFPVTVLFNGNESGIGEKGTRIDEAVEFAKLFEAAGADALQVRNYGYGEDTARQWIENTVYPEPVSDMPKALDWSRDGAGAYVPLARAVKQAVSIPVITVGRQGAELGEETLEAGDADFIAMQRRLIADPDLPNKVKEGRLAEVKPCTACLYCASSPGTGRLRCRVNSRAGLPNDYRLTPAETRKRVAVIGGGPGGMEVARVAAERGHEVTLYEKAAKLGGLMPMATIIKGTRTENLMELVAYYETQLRKLGVKVKTKSEFIPSMASKFDEVVVATGAQDATFDIPGVEKKIFMSNEALHAMLDKLLRRFKPETLRNMTEMFLPMGKRIVIIGGEIQGAELAEFLLLRGRKVTLVTQGGMEEIGKGMASIKQVYLMHWFAKQDIDFVTNVKEYRRIDDKGLVILDANGEEILVPGDSVCTALPLEPSTKLYDAIKAQGTANVRMVGTCESGDGIIIDSIADAYETACQL